MRKGRREWKGRSPGARLFTRAPVGLRGPDSGVGLWASANLPQEGAWEFLKILQRHIRPKKG